LYKATGTAFMGKVSDRQYGGAAADKYKSIEETANAKARAKAEAEAAKRQRELLALQKKSAIAEKNKLSLSKAAAVFDSTRISLAAALQATYDKETRLRLEALIAIENDQGDLALKKINELAALQKNADLAKLAGITTISDLALSNLNTLLLAELKVINDSKMAESQKEAARQIAFGKYNEALVKAGGLAEKNSYDEKIQIQLTEVERLASLSNTTNAAITLGKVRESAELDLIDRVAAAQKKADDARLASLNTYLAALGRGGAQAMPNAYVEPYPQFNLTNQIAQGSFTQGLEQGLSLAAALSGANYAAQAAAAAGITTTTAPTTVVELTVNAGVIAEPDAFVGLVQTTIQRLNRGGDPLTTAGIL
jgi:hypothetical protein